MKWNVLSSNNGFVLVWTLSFSVFIFMWISYTMLCVNDFQQTQLKYKEVEERLRFEAMMRKHFENEDVAFVKQGKYAFYKAEKKDEKLYLSVLGATNLKYIYDIMEDESLILITMEE